MAVTGLDVYIAAPWIDKERMEVIAKQFEEVGHRITHKWWDNEDSPLEDEAYRDVKNLEKCAVLDFCGVGNADVVVVLNTAKSEGKATEQGIAIAMDKPIIAVGERGKESKNVFHYLPNYFWVPTVEIALEVMKEWLPIFEVAEKEQRAIMSYLTKH